jgi:pimeloyl-ACP methyl ester carboxylesterase
LDALDVKQAHVVGHSYSTLVAVRLAIDVPEVVSSLALFDPSPLVVMNPEQVAEVVRQWGRGRFEQDVVDGW